MMPYAYAPPAQLNPLYAAPLDDRDDAIVQEAAFAQLAVVGKEEVDRSRTGQTGRNIWAALSGHHTAERVRIYRLRAVDGMAWTYAQPYSGSAQMPGEHHFVLRGSFAHPVEVLPPHRNWRKFRFVMAVCVLTLFLLFLFGAGLLFLLLMILLFPPRAQYRSPDKALAKWLSSQPIVRDVVRATRFGWVGFLGTGGWKLRWVIQLYARGDGTSTLVCKAPDVGRIDFTRARVGFAQATAIARAFQAVMPQTEALPSYRGGPPMAAPPAAQRPLDEPLFSF
jgi:hypothetical protein